MDWLILNPAGIKKIWPDKDDGLVGSLCFEKIHSAGQYKAWQNTDWLHYWEWSLARGPPAPTLLPYVVTWSTCMLTSSFWSWISVITSCFNLEFKTAWNQTFGTLNLLVCVPWFCLLSSKNTTGHEWIYSSQISYMMTVSFRI